MLIQSVTLSTSSTAALRTFYSAVLGLECTGPPERLSISVGASQLIYRQDANFQGFYHLAFEIPRNLSAAAQEWLTQRVPLLPDAEGNVAFEPSENWNTRNLYFADPAGNILELIARFDRPTDQPGPFDSGHLLNISEVGLVVPDVPGAVAELGSTYGLRPFNGQSDTFTAVGGHDGMLIVVPEGRGWFPIDQAAVASPLRVEFADGAVTRIVSSSTPFKDA